MLGVYVHIPFCEKKCTYCAFSSFADFSQKEKYITSLCDEINAFSRKGECVDTIYFGGGTPSTVEPQEIEKILAAIKNQFNVNSNCEITIECNPNSITREKLVFYKKLGINRLSLGVQSLNDDQLKFAGRLHNAEQAINALRLAKKVGFENVSADLLIGLPGCNYADFEDMLKTLLNEGVKHISTYMLQVEENTKLKKMIDDNPELMPDDDNMVEILSKTANFLKKNGFLHYEVSNFALKGYESKHNYKYWSGEEYVGFGLAAHSFLDGKRIANPSDFKDYFDRKNVFSESLTNDQKIEEHIMLGLRCNRGINTRFLKNLGYDIEQNDYFNEFVNKKILIKDGEKIFLAEDYYYVNNFIIVSLLC